jgi:hypothetical protein
MTKEYADHVRDLSAHEPDLAKQFSDWHGLESVLNWIKDRNLPAGAIDLIGQDEFEYDFVIALDPDGPWVVFGLT